MAAPLGNLGAPRPRPARWRAQIPRDRGDHHDRRIRKGSPVWKIPDAPDAQLVPDPPAPGPEVPPGNIPPVPAPEIPPPDPAPPPLENPGDVPLPPITDPDVIEPGEPNPAPSPPRAYAAKRSLLDCGAYQPV
ncbi:MAG: hypothetical protein ACT4O2_03835 [Beijerinckiaceae bacterium]